MRQNSTAPPLFGKARRQGEREALITWPLPFAMAVRPAIFLPRDAGVWDPVTRRAILAHERVHHRQQRVLGLARFAVAYFCSRRLRWRIERAGYRRQFAVYLRHGLAVDQEVFARMVSGPFYAWMIGRAEARQWCEETLRRRGSPHSPGR